MKKTQSIVGHCVKKYIDTQISMILLLNFSLSYVSMSFCQPRFVFKYIHFHLNLSTIQFWYFSWEVSFIIGTEVPSVWIAIQLLGVKLWRWFFWDYQWLAETTHNDNGVFTGGHTHLQQLNVDMYPVYIDIHTYIK